MSRVSFGRLMEVSVNTTQFARVLRLVQPITERKTTIPILGTILLSADANGLMVSGTDLELGGFCRCPAIVKKPGSLAVPAHRLTEHVKMLPEGDLRLKEQASHWLALSCGRSRSRMAGSAVDSFPELPQPPEGGVTLPGALLARLVEKVIFAISTEESTATLSGALLKFDQSGLTMVATDGHRLALAATQLEIPDLQEPFEVLVHKKALSQFLRFSEGQSDQPVRCSVTENHLFFAWKERLLLNRRLNGSFPNYERVLPSQYSRLISLDRKELRVSIERVSRFSDAETRCIVVEVSQGQMMLRAEDGNIGDSEAILPIAYADGTVRIGCNASYLADFWRAPNRNMSNSCFRTNRVPPNCGRIHRLETPSIGMSSCRWRFETNSQRSSYLVQERRVMFTELSPLLAGRTLVLTVAQIDNGLIRLNVIPKRQKENDSGEKALTTPLSVTGTAADLDRDLPAQLSGYASSMLQTGSTLAQVQTTHRAAFKEIETENRKTLESKRKSAVSKTPPKPEAATAVSEPVFKDGKPVFGTK